MIKRITGAFFPFQLIFVSPFKRSLLFNTYISIILLMSLTRTKPLFIRRIQEPPTKRIKEKHDPSQHVKLEDSERYFLRFLVNLKVNINLKEKKRRKEKEAERTRKRQRSSLQVAVNKGAKN